MLPKVKVPKLEKTQKLLPFCTVNNQLATTNCDPENNDQDKASKPSSSEERKAFG